MSYLVVMIAINLDQCHTILEAWEQLGVPGITILESTGLGHLKHSGYWDDIPLMPSIHDLFEKDEVHHRTFFSVVEEREMIDKMIAAVHKITGDLEDPHTGFLFVVPVLEVHGMGRHRKDRSQE